MTEKILAALFLFIKSLIATSGYGGIVMLMAIESACIPLPSELIMPFAGYLVYEGGMKLLWVATAGAIGCNLGSLVAYEVGCYGGPTSGGKHFALLALERLRSGFAVLVFSRSGGYADVEMS